MCKTGDRDRYGHMEVSKLGLDDGHTTVVIVPSKLSCLYHASRIYSCIATGQKEEEESIYEYD